MIVYDLTKPSDMTDEKMKEILSTLMTAHLHHERVKSLDIICEKTVSGEIEFMDEEKIDEIKLNFKGEIL